MIILPALTDAELVAHINQIGPQTKVEEALLERLEELSERSAIIKTLDDLGIDTTDAVAVRKELNALFDRVEALELDLRQAHKRINELLEY